MLYVLEHPIPNDRDGPLPKSFGEHMLSTAVWLPSRHTVADILASAMCQHVDCKGQSASRCAGWCSMVLAIVAVGGVILASDLDAFIPKVVTTTQIAAIYPSHPRWPPFYLCGHNYAYILC